MYQRQPADFGPLADAFYQMWPEAHEAPRRSEGRIALAGLPGSGKKTLINSLWGWEALTELPDEPVHRLGLFTLVTLPEEAGNGDDLLYALESADLVIYLLDGVAGPQPADIRWLARLRALPATLLIVLNKADLLGGTIAPEVLAGLRDQLARPVLPLSASDGRAVHDRFLPAVLKACPQLAVPLAAEITGLRWRVVQRLIHDSAVMSGLSTLENGATVDIHALLDLQRRLLRQIAQVYGFREDDDATPGPWTLVQRAVLHQLARVMQDLGPLGRRLAALLISVSGTWAAGQQAQAHYDGARPAARLATLLRRSKHHDAGQDGT